MFKTRPRFFSRDVNSLSAEDLKKMELADATVSDMDNGDKKAVTASQDKQSLSPKGHLSEQVPAEVNNQNRLTNK